MENDVAPQGRESCECERKLGLWGRGAASSLDRKLGKFHLRPQLDLLENLCQLLVFDLRAPGPRQSAEVAQVPFRNVPREEANPNFIETIEDCLSSGPLPRRLGGRVCNLLNREQWIDGQRAKGRDAGRRWMFFGEVIGKCAGCPRPAVGPSPSDGRAAEWR